MQNEEAKTIQTLERELNSLKRRYNRLEERYSWLSALYENSERVRDKFEEERSVQSFYNWLLLEVCSDYIFLLDVNMRYVLGSKDLERRIGCSFSDGIIGCSIDEVFGKKFSSYNLERMLANCEHVLETSSPLYYNSKVELLDESDITMQVSITPAIDKEGNSHGVVVVLHDVTELLGAVEKAHMAMEAKNIFLANMSHEIRTPMNAIKSMSDLMMMTQLSDLQKTYASTISGASESLLSIINDILDFSKIEADKMELLEEPYCITSVLTDITNITALKAAERGLTVFTSIDPHIPSMLVGDAVRIKQVLLNLTSNAVKFTAEGYVRISISSVRNSDNEVLLTVCVKDTGIGIKQEEAEKLFEPFSRLDMKHNREVQGTGLGLSISNRIVALMRGKLEVESVYGEGSSFFFTIPQKIAYDEPIAAIKDCSQLRVIVLADEMHCSELGVMLRSLSVEFELCCTKEEFQRALGYFEYTHIIYTFNMNEIVERCGIKNGKTRLIIIKNMKFDVLHTSTPGVEVLFEPVMIFSLARLLSGLDVKVAEVPTDSRNSINFNIINTNILSVDDNPVNLMVFESLMRQYGIEIDSAKSGFEALELIKNKKYDMIFMDHMMPEMDGIETTRRIRVMLGDFKIPIVALTANAVVGIRQLFLKSLMNDFISKPIEIRELNNVLRTWLPPEKIVPVSKVIDECPEGSENRNGHNDIIKDMALFLKDDLYVDKAIANVGGSKEECIRVFGVFVRTLPDRLAKLEQYALNKEWESFRIEVHAFKGALFSIGADVLAKNARSLEMAAQSSQIKYIDEHYIDFIRDLSIFGKKIDEIMKKHNAPVALKEERTSPEDRKQLSASLTRLRVFLDSFAHDEAFSLLRRLQRFSYGDKVDQCLERTLLHLEEYDYEQAVAAMNLCDEILGTP